jgi:AraC-like DNA-binding protein
MRGYCIIFDKEVIIQMDCFFLDYKNKLLNTPDECYTAFEPISYEYIGDTKVGLFNYYEEAIIAGLWLQVSDYKVRTFSRVASPKMPEERLFMAAYNREGESTPIHRHQTIELGYVIEGCSRQIFSGKEYMFNAGDFWLTDRNCYHSDVFFNKNLFTVYIAIPTSFFDSAFWGFVEDSQIQHFIYSALLDQKKIHQFLHFTPRINRHKAAKFMRQIFDELASVQIGFKDITKGLLSRLLATLSFDYDFLFINQQRAKINQLLYQEIESYMRLHYQTVTIRDLIDLFHYNEDFYNRLIKEYSGYTYTQYLQKIRLAQAEELLIKTKLPVDEIAIRVGYQSKSYFYRIFYDSIGMTPAQYRQKHNLGI